MGLRSWFLENAYPLTYPSILTRRLKEEKMNSILDISAGDGNLARSIHKRFKGYMVGTDLFLPDLRRCLHDDRVLCDSRSLPFKDQGFGCVLASGIIEHLEKKDGMLFLSELERLSSAQIIVYTSNGFLPQGALEGNPFQVHRSAWSPTEFEGKGYHVYGISGLKRPPYPVNRLKRIFGFRPFIFLSQLVTYLNPRFAYHLLAVRNR